MSEPAPPGWPPPDPPDRAEDAPVTGQGTPETEYAPLLSTSDAAFLPFVKSLLESAGIPCMVQGEEALGLFPLGPLGSTLEAPGLGATVHVPKDRLQEAEALLREAAQGEPGGDEAEG